ncbi:transposase, partial [mine drainage metagenome]
MVYHNGARGVRESDQRNGALAEITAALGKLSEQGAAWSEAKLHKAIREVVGRWAPYLEVRVTRKGKEKGPRVTWSYHQHALRAAERRDGKFALLVTDPKLS